MTGARFFEGGSIHLQPCDCASTSLAVERASGARAYPDTPNRATSPCGPTGRCRRPGDPRPLVPVRCGRSRPAAGRRIPHRRCRRFRGTDHAAPAGGPVAGVARSAKAAAGGKRAEDAPALGEVAIGPHDGDEVAIRHQRRCKVPQRRVLPAGRDLLAIRLRQRRRIGMVGARRQQPVPLAPCNAFRNCAAYSALRRGSNASSSEVKARGWTSG